MDILAAEWNVCRSQNMERSTVPSQIATQDAHHAVFHPRAMAVIQATDDTTEQGGINLVILGEAGAIGVNALVVPSS